MRLLVPAWLGFNGKAHAEGTTLKEAALALAEPVPPSDDPAARSPSQL